MRVHDRICIETPDGREFRITRHTHRGTDVGTLQVAVYCPKRSDWEIQDLSRNDVRMVRDFLNNWLGEDN